MLGKEGLKLILGNKEFPIPSEFHLLSNINPEIYSELIKNGEYVVKSYVDEDTLQSFIDYLVNRHIPNIIDQNLDEYIELSTEFDCMKSLINIYQNNKRSKSEKNMFLKYRLKKLEKEKEDKKNQFKKVISLLETKDFSKYIITDEEKNLQRIKCKLELGCQSGNLKFIDSFTRQIVVVDQIQYVIFEEDKTAALFNVGYEVFGSICIPRSIKYNGEEFIVTTILQRAFWLTNVWQIEFEKDSELELIDNEAFYNCALRTIKVPSHVTRIGDKAFYYSNQFLFAEFKDDSELETIGQEAFAHTKIEKIKIPSHLKKIESFVFNDCQNLKTVEFQDNSELRQFNPFCFISCAFETIKIPRSLRRIQISAFYKCFLLKNIEIPEDSELRRIEQNAFICTSINKLFIPEKVDQLVEGWNHGTPELNYVTLSPMNKNYSNVNDKFIFGKSRPKNEIFDVLCFAKRNLTEVTIPNYIIKIASCAFSGCEKLKNVDFQENSQLKKIGEYAFFMTAIEKIKIPIHVRKISKNTFYGCSQLKLVEIPNDSEIKLIDKNSFVNKDVNILAPPNLINSITFIELKEKE